METQTEFQIELDFLTSKTIVVEPTAGQMSSDGGLLLFRQLDEQLGMTRQFAETLGDRRVASRTDHSVLEMVRMRVFGILADYPDQNDHDVLRFDPVFKLLCDRSPSQENNDLASQPTLSRFENSIDVSSFFRLEERLLEEFVASFDEPPRELTLDIDPFDDPAYGQQQLIFYHGYYEQYQYLARAITCAENDLVLAINLLYGTAHAALGAADDIERIVRRLREVWPDVQIHVRGDSAFGVPSMYDGSEQLRVLYSFGIGMNPKLKGESEATFNEAVRLWEQTGQPQRLFCAFWYPARSWPAARWVIVKCEANAQGTNRRAIVTNRPGAQVLPGAAYDEYADRGESENRNKELKRGLMADRLSDHRYFANYFRLHLHTLAYNLLVRMRQATAAPPAATTHGPDALPTEALVGRQRRQSHNHRRQHDPLGEGHACTWRSRLIKVAAWIVESQRRVVVRLSSSWPHLDLYETISRRILALASHDTG